jgi:NADH-quinone oxidoreductase subunit K
MLVTLFADFTLVTLLFMLAVLGVALNRRNILIILMSIELMLLSVNLGLLLTASYFDDLLGELFALLVLCVAAGESAIGLAIIVVYYRLRGSISMNTLNLLKG